MQPKFSIIVPIYNSEHTICRCLNSILKQTLNDIEIICVNDASTDNSNIILERYKREDSRIKVINLQTNSGVAAARNAGLNAAKGTIVGFVDSDDDIDESHLEDIFNKMQKENSDINIISFKFIKLNKIIYFPDVSNFVAKFGSATQKMDTVEKLTFLDDYCWRLSIRSSFWQKHRIYFPEGIKGSEDQCFWKPLQLMANKISILENYGYNYHWSRTSLTKQEMSSFETIRGVDELMRRLPKEYHLPLMEKCCKRIHDFEMKNNILKNKLKYEYVKRIYRKAKEYGIKNYELGEYNYSRGLYVVKKNTSQKEIFLLGIPLYKILYTKQTKEIYLLGRLKIVCSKI